jgi:hypothetical protein
VVYSGLADHDYDHHHDIDFLHLAIVPVGWLIPTSQFH